MAKMRRLTFLAIHIGLALSLLAQSGCAFLGLKKQLVTLDTVVYYTGTVSETTKTTAPVIVVLYSVENDQATPVMFDLIPKGEGFYHLIAPAGDYRILAFQDTNRNFDYQPGEPIAFLEGAPQNARADMGAQTSGQIVFTDSASTTPVPPIFGQQFGKLIQTAVTKVGEVTTLDDPRFGDAMISKGVYQPLEFVGHVGPRLYMLQPYDPKRTPVVFIHGMYGSPTSFRKMIAGLDQTRYQPWVFYWPTGVRVEFSGWLLDQELEFLQYRLGYDHCDIVGYSMGGLVARTAMNLRAKEDRSLSVRNFISISTPWGGDPNATDGVNRSPVVVPSWHNMDPTGTYIKTLFDQSWPQRVRYVLFFGYGGGGGSTNADGVVLLRSALTTDAQNHAIYIFGFNDDHMTILNDPDVIKKLNEQLEMPAVGNTGGSVTQKISP
jgi:pimeloyl-ACP methyl ester carboxylesterase